MTRTRGGMRSGARVLRGRLPVVAGVAGLVVGVTATLLVADSGTEEPNPVVDYADADEDLVRTAADAWRAEPPADRPRGALSVVHAGRAGDADVVVLLDETGLGSAYARPADGEGEVRWVTQVGAAADREDPGPLAARSLLVGPADVWVGDGSSGTDARLEAAVLAGDEVEWRPLDTVDGVALDVPEAGPDGCGLRVVAERGDEDVLYHAVRSERSPVGALLLDDVRPLDGAGRRPPEDRPRVAQRGLGAAQLRLLSRAACVDKSETRELMTRLWFVSELWRGELPAGGTASLLTLGTGERNLLLLGSDAIDSGGWVLGRDVPGTLWRDAAVASWYDSTDPAADGPYRHWIVVAGTEEVERIEVVLADGRRITGRGRYLTVDLAEYGVDRGTSYEVTAVDGDGDPVRVLR